MGNKPAHNQQHFTFARPSKWLALTWAQEISWCAELNQEQWKHESSPIIGDNWEASRLVWEVLVNFPLTEL
jgi:hypothetical protein